MKDSSTVILRNEKKDMYKGYMRLAVDRWGRVESTKSVDFSANVDCNLSLFEFEVITSREVFITVISELRISLMRIVKKDLL
ncbi:putative nucleic acid-binding, OB-fold protein, partial [Tanacetum coccineum]